MVLFGLSYGAESLAHAMLPGLVIAALAGFPLVLGAALGVAIAAPAVALAGRLPTIGADTAIAVVVTSLVGAGALLALAPDSPAGIHELLFGDVLGVSSGELLLTAALAVVVLAALRGRARKAADGGLRPHERARLRRQPAGGRHAAAAAHGRRSRSSPCRRSGPCWCSRCWSGRQRPRASSRTGCGAMMALATAIAAGGGAGGLYLSYYADTAAGASIAAVVVAVHIAAVAGLRLSRRPG